MRLVRFPRLLQCLYGTLQLFLCVSHSFFRLNESWSLLRYLGFLMTTDIDFIAFMWSFRIPYLKTIKRNKRKRTENVTSRNMYMHVNLF